MTANAARPRLRHHIVLMPATHPCDYIICCTREAMQTPQWYAVPFVAHPGWDLGTVDTAIGHAVAVPVPGTSRLAQLWPTRKALVEALGAVEVVTL